MRKVNAPQPNEMGVGTPCHENIQILCLFPLKFFVEQKMEKDEFCNNNRRVSVDDHGSSKGEENARRINIIYCNHSK